MKNIQKIAEEIFRTPTKEELIHRALKNIRFLSRAEYEQFFQPRHTFEIHSFDDEEVSELFPNGAHFVSSYDVARRDIDKFDAYFKDVIQQWQPITWKHNYWIGKHYRWSKAKLNGKTVMRAFRPTVVNAYWFEKGAIQE